MCDVLEELVRVEDLLFEDRVLIGDTVGDGGNREGGEGVEEGGREGRERRVGEGGVLLLLGEMGKVFGELFEGVLKLGINGLVNERVEEGGWEEKLDGKVVKDGFGIVDVGGGGLEERDMFGGDREREKVEREIEE
ncbi:hypothetical protein [Neisseria sicca]|uniref:hypothetical protein n=1 Tax=Neisseria sicca TaxID=490 RepID=UPI0011BD096B|nr:hypothetical protein [Neisseria sicca]